MSSAVATLPIRPWTKEERNFLAEDTLIEISPFFNHGVIHLLCGDFGPFKPMINCKVPLWLAVALKKANHCSIIVPFWMDAAHLEGKLNQERMDSKHFTEMGFHWIEVAQLLLDAAGDDIPKSEIVRYLIQNIKEVRNNKITLGMSDIDGSPQKMNNISLCELNQISNSLSKISDEVNDFTTVIAETKTKTMPSQIRR